MSDDRELPPPGTATEMYLAAAVDRLGKILDRLPPPPPVPPSGEVDLREPAAARTETPARKPAGKGSGVGASGRPARPAPTPSSTAGKRVTKPKPAKGTGPGRRATGS